VYIVKLLLINVKRRAPGESDDGSAVEMKAGDVRMRLNNCLGGFYLSAHQWLPTTSEAIYDGNG